MAKGTSSKKERKKEKSVFLPIKSVIFFTKL